MATYELVGRNVEVFLEGGWTFIGLVEYSSSEIIVLVDNDGPLILYKNKIVAAKILEDKIIEKPIEVVEPIEYSNQTMPIIEDENRQLNHYGSIIPEDMLEGESDPTPVSFSISMSDFTDPVEKKSKYGPSKKTRAYRKKNTG